MGFVDRVKHKLAPASKSSAPASGMVPGRAPQRSQVLGQMDFEQAQSFLAPEGPLDRARRPPASRGVYMTKPPGPANLNVASHSPRGPIPATYATMPTKPASQYDSMPPLARPQPRSEYMKQIGPQAPRAQGAQAQGAQARGVYMTQVAPQAPAQAPQADDDGNIGYLNQTEIVDGQDDASVDIGYLNQAEIVDEQDEAAVDIGYLNHTGLIDAPQGEVAQEVDAHAPIGNGMEAHAAPAHAPQHGRANMPLKAPALPLDGKSMARLREGAAKDFDLERANLTEAEQQNLGWALLPINGFQLMNDGKGSANGGFDTMYHFADEAERDASPHGHQQTTARGDYVLELKNGKLSYSASGEELDSSALSIPGFTIAEFYKGKEAEVGRKLTKEERIEHAPELMAAGGRYIFVMDGQGRIYAGENFHKVQHHSSFLGGGAVAAAGELQASGGSLTRVSNMSGHYRPGPGYLWQAIVQMASQGVDMSGVSAQIAGVGEMNAAEFMRVFDPVANPDLMKAAVAIDFLKRHLSGSSKDEVGEAREAKSDVSEGKAEVSPGKAEVPDAVADRALKLVA